MRQLRPWIASLLLIAATACSATLSAVAPAATNTGLPCIPPGPPPAWALVSPAPMSRAVGFPGSVLLSTSSGNPPFSATLVLVPMQGATVAGSALVAATPPPNPQSGTSYFSATYPSLAQSTSYDLQIALVQYTNLPPGCRKHFTIDLGPITTVP